MAELVRIGTMPGEVADLIARAVRMRKNIMISGGTGSGKTSLLNALATEIAPDDRLVVIEDTAELQIDQSNLLRFEARRAQGEVPEVSIRDLVRATLRHRPDRIIVGEVRGPEAFDLLQALNTGHGGTLTTIHANSASLALNRLTTCVLMSEVGLPFAAIRSQIADSIDILVHIERQLGGRRVLTEVLEMSGYDYGADRFDLATIYQGRETHAAAAA